MGMHSFVPTEDMQHENASMSGVVETLTNVEAPVAFGEGNEGQESSSDGANRPDTSTIFGTGSGSVVENTNRRRGARNTGSGGWSRGWVEAGRGRTRTRSDYCRGNPSNRGRGENNRVRGESSRARGEGYRGRGEAYRGRGDGGREETWRAGFDVNRGRDISRGRVDYRRGGGEITRGRGGGEITRGRGEGFRARGRSPRRRGSSPRGIGDRRLVRHEFPSDPIADQRMQAIMYEFSLLYINPPIGQLLTMPPPDTQSQAFAAIPGQSQPSNSDQA